MYDPFLTDYQLIPGLFPEGGNWWWILLIVLALLALIFILNPGNFIKKITGKK
jgi:hypothetical protein